jgi:hypothetical protein
MATTRKKRKVQAAQVVTLQTISPLLYSLLASLGYVLVGGVTGILGLYQGVEQTTGVHVETRAYVFAFLLGCVTAGLRIYEGAKDQLKAKVIPGDVVATVKEEGEKLGVTNIT